MRAKVRRGRAAVPIITGMAYFLLVPLGFCGGPGTSGADFLNIPLAARPASLGGAFAALADDVNAIAYNPAGLAQLGSQQAAFTHNRYFEGVTQEWAAYAYPHPRWGTFGIGLNSLSVDGFDAYDENDEPMGSVSASDLAVNMAYARGAELRGAWLREILWGVNLKYIQERLDTEKAAGFGADLGLLLKPAWRGVRIGLGADNVVGTKMKFVEEGFPLPLKGKAGASYGIEPGERYAFACSIEGHFPADGDPYVALGVENRLYDVLAIRAGYESYRDVGSGLTFGVGLRMGRLLPADFEVDYAFVDSGDLDTVHRFGILMRFARGEEAEPVRGAGSRRRPAPKRAAVRPAGRRPAAESEPAPRGRAAASSPGETAAAPPAERWAAEAEAASAPGTFAYFARALENGDEYERYEAVEGLGEMGGGRAVKLLVASLKDEYASVRAHAAMALGKLGVKSAVGPVLELLKDRDKDARLGAIIALGLLRDRRAVRPLTGMLRDGHPDVRMNAATVLGYFGGLSAIRALEGALKDEDGRVRAAAEKALKRLEEAGR
ncbi:MAG: PorV/PorQ family protein [Elusimicrobiota bacterium]